jgi:hypothetical protein
MRTAVRTIVRTTRPLALLLGATLLLAACAEPAASGSGATIVEPDDDTTEAPEEDTVAEDAADAEEADTAAEVSVDEGADAEDEGAESAAVLGTRDAPLPLGTVIEMGDWTIAVTDVTVDATDLVMAENEFNDPPVEGRQFVLFRVEATYEGDDSGNPWLDFSWAIVGSGGNTFGGASFDDYCGVIPDALDERGETFPGGSVEGNVCISAASDQLEGGTIFVEETFSFQDTRAFFALP